MLHSGSACLIERHIPHHNSLAPIAEHVDDLAFHVIAEIGSKVGCPEASGAFSKEDGSAGIKIVNSVLSIGNVSAVAVKGHAREIGTHCGILDKLLRISRIVPVMFVAENA